MRKIQKSIALIALALTASTAKSEIYADNIMIHFTGTLTTEYFNAGFSCQGGKSLCVLPPPKIEKYSGYHHIIFNQYIPETGIYEEPYNWKSGFRFINGKLQSYYILDDHEMHGGCYGFANITTVTQSTFKYETGYCDEYDNAGILDGQDPIREGQDFDYGIMYLFTYEGRITKVEGVQFLGHVPEPTQWAMMIAGFGLVGTALRRARQPTKHLNLNNATPNRK